VDNHNRFPGGSAEWAALYAAGALTGPERMEFEAHLAGGCQACDAELQQLGPVVAALGGSARPVTPHPGLRESLIQRISATPMSPLRRHLHQSPLAHPALVTRRAADGVWEPSDVAGVSLRVLHVDRSSNQFTALVRMASGASYPRHVHGGPEQCLVLEGDLHVGDDVLGPGDYQRAEAGSLHGVQTTERGCLLMITSSLTDAFT
jgi:anti-sigma factor ChrR (cupin superfamily)